MPVKIIQPHGSRRPVGTGRTQARSEVGPTMADRFGNTQIEPSTPVDVFIEDATTKAPAQAAPPMPSAGREKPLGGGWYELTNGERVRGQEAARAAQAALTG